MHRRKYFRLLFLSLMILILLSACGAQATEMTPTLAQLATSVTATAATAITSTPDLCAPNNIADQVRKIHNVMCKFDDFVFVANLTPQAQLSPIIIDLQVAGRETEDLDIPVCLATLQAAALNYQNTVVMDWISIEDANVPGGMAWVYAKLIEMNVSINHLPVVVPAPSPTSAG